MTSPAHKNQAPSEVFVHSYPPFGLALGMSYLTWLTGSIAWDSFFAQPTDLLLGCIFIFLFAFSLAMGLSAWSRIFRLSKAGLNMTRSGIGYFNPAWPLHSPQQIGWAEIVNIELIKDELVIETQNEKYRISTANLLENPAWLLERISAWRTWFGGQSAIPEHDLWAKMESGFEGLVCKFCAGKLEVKLGNNEQTICSHCGATQALLPRTREILKHLSKIIRDLPQAHRQFQEKCLRRYIGESAKQRRRLLTAGWGTAAVWLLFASVNVLSDLLRDDIQTINLRIPCVFLILSAVSVFSAHLVARLLDKVAKTYSFPLRALAPLQSGGPARCRFCGANLPGTGVLRRCSYCGTDSVAAESHLASAEKRANEILRQVKHTVSQGTESAGRLLDSTALKLQWFIYTQLLWLHIPILVALDGNPGMLSRVTSVLICVLMGNMASFWLGVRWLRRDQS